MAKRMCAEWQHPASGERYAVIVEEDIVTAAYGPLHYSEGRGEGALRDILENQSTETLEDTAAWIQDERVR